MARKEIELFSNAVEEFPVAMDSAFAYPHGISFLRSRASSLYCSTGWTRRRASVSKRRQLTQLPKTKRVTISSLQLNGFNIPLTALSVLQEVGQDVTRELFAGSMAVVVMSFVLIALYGLAARRNYDAVSCCFLLVESLLECR